jgi:hypothetical protein
VCPLWTETATLLQLLSDHTAGSAPDRPVFASLRRTALTRFGIYKIVRRYTADIVKRGSDGRPRRVSPHTWRHATAVHLLEAGVEINVIHALHGWGTRVLRTRTVTPRSPSVRSKPPSKSAACPWSEKREFRQHLKGRATQPCCIGCSRCSVMFPRSLGPRGLMGPDKRPAT